MFYINFIVSPLLSLLTDDWRTNLMSSSRAYHILNYTWVLFAFLCSAFTAFCIYLEALDIIELDLNCQKRAGESSYRWVPKYLKTYTSVMWYLGKLCGPFFDSLTLFMSSLWLSTLFQTYNKAPVSFYNVSTTAIWSVQLIYYGIVGVLMSKNLKSTKCNFRMAKSSYFPNYCRIIAGSTDY